MRCLSSIFSVTAQDGTQRYATPHICSEHLNYSRNPLTGEQASEHTRPPFPLIRSCMNTRMLPYRPPAFVREQDKKKRTERFRPFRPFLALRLSRTAMFIDATHVRDRSASRTYCFVTADADAASAFLRCLKDNVFGVFERCVLTTRIVDNINSCVSQYVRTDCVH